MTTTDKTESAEKPTLAIVPPGAEALRAKFQTIESELNQQFAEREQEIRGVVVATLAREHILLLGPAGTGKSAIAHAFCGAIDHARYFQWLLTRFSTPEELFGPVSLDGLKHDRFRRVTTNKLPEANVAFLDEIYKANSAVLNALLTALNERAFDDDLGRRRIPLETVVGASNELPEGPELAALHDRFLLRYWTAYTKTPDAFTLLLTGGEPAIAAAVTLQELSAAQAAVESMPMPKQTIDELFKLRNEVGKLGIQASDRRWKKCARVLRAAAWYDGAAEVSPEAFPILAHVLWETVDQIAKLQQVVAKYTSAELSEATDVHDAMAELMGNLPAKNDGEYPAKVTSVTRELKRAIEKITSLENACRGGQSKAKIVAMRKGLDKKYAGLRKDAAEALGL